MKYFILIFFCLAFTGLKSQENVVLTKTQNTNLPILKNTKSIDNQNETINNLIYDQSTKKVYFIFSTPTDSFIYSKGDQFPSGVAKCGIITEDGIKINFSEPNFDVLNIRGDIVIIDTRDRYNSCSLIKKYRIKNNKPILLKEISFKSFDLNYCFLDNYIVMTDEYEGLGGILEIYNTDLIKVKGIMPYPKSSYLETYLLSDKQFFINISRSYKHPDSLLFLYFDKNFKQLKKYMVDIAQYQILFVRLIDNNIYIGAQTPTLNNHEPFLFCYDFSGKLLWKSSFNFPYGYRNIELVKSGSTLWGYINTESALNNIYKINALNGEIISRMDLDSLYATNIANNIYTKNRKLIPFLFDLNNDKTISALLGDCTILNKSECKCENNTLFLIDPEKQSYSLIRLPASYTDDRPVRLFQDGNNLIFTFTNKILYYETH